MPVIIIREEQQTESGFNAFLIINSQEYSITISDPFQPQDEKILEWYFEGWLVTPMLHTETAKNAADSVEHYGLSLFEQVFKSDFNAYSNYCQLRVNLKEVQFEIQSKTPEFQSLHWEGMKDPELPRPLVELIDQGNLRVNLEILRPGTYESLCKHLEAKGSNYYHIIHFDLHGGLMTYAEFQKGVEKNRYLYQRGYGLEHLDPYNGMDAYLQVIQLLESLNNVEEQAKQSKLAITYHQLGYVAQELREWEEARNYYQQALSIYIEYSDRYSQARTYYCLGMVAEATGNPGDGKNYYLQALQIWVEFNDEYWIGNSLQNLQRFYQENPDDSILEGVASIFNTTVEDIRSDFNDS